MRSFKMRLVAGVWGALLWGGAAMAQDAPSAGTTPGGVNVAPAPWLAQDPADSLYRVGRGALNRGDYRIAAEAFRTLRDRHPRSGYVADAYYWEAFARSKVGGRDDLRTALTLLDRQAERHGEARTLRDARELRVRVQGELARLGDESAAVAVAEAVGSLAGSSTGIGRGSGQAAGGAGQGARGVGRSQRGACNDDDDIRMTALKALLNMRAEQAVPILQDVLQKRDEGSACMRRQAVFLLSQKRSPETARLLLDAVRNDPDREVRENAVFWLSQVNTPEATAALDSILQHGADREIQEKAVFALSQQRGEAASRALRNHLERAGVPDEIKENIIFWLGQKRSEENAQYLRDLYGKPSTSPKMKEKIIFSLSQMGLEGNARWLIGIATDEREPIDVRKDALFWAGQMRQVPFTELSGIYGRIQSREMKEQLIFVYSQRREREAVTALIDIARTEADPELRKKAVFWLGQSRDPRAAEFLVELINR
jgi:HEAT repeat protein